MSLLCSHKVLRALVHLLFIISWKTYKSRITSWAGLATFQPPEKKEKLRKKRAGDT